MARLVYGITIDQAKEETKKTYLKYKTPLSYDIY